MSKQPPPAPIASAIGPCPTIIRIVGRPGTGRLPRTFAPPDHTHSDIERLVRRLRETGRVADRPRSGRPRVTSQRQDRAIRLAHLRNRHLTSMETAVNTVGSHKSPYSSENRKESVARVWSTSPSGTSRASYGLGDSTGS